MPTIARDLRNALETCLLSIAGSEYNKLKYLGNLEQNSFSRGHDTRYGVRPGETPENDTAEVNNALTYTQSFQFVLTKGFCDNDGVSDTGQYEAFLDLHEIALGFNNKVVKTKAGLPSRVMNVVDFTLDGPIFLEQDKVAVLTGNIDIIYRLTL